MTIHGTLCGQCTTRGHMSYRRKSYARTLLLSQHLRFSENVSGDLYFVILINTDVDLGTKVFRKRMLSPLSCDILVGVKIGVCVG